jgi:hypothetical protein
MPNPPDAAALMMSARSFGNYDLPSALADLIDNSIKARASAVRITCRFNDGDPLVSVVDDGHGMTRGELHAAMRPASTNPMADRSPDDLGRFGWGMKSASFSQCTKLTVLSRRSGEVSGAVWDLSDVDKWKMGILGHREIEEIVHPALVDRDGTQVIWSNCDRLSEEGLLDEDDFNRLIVHARTQLALVFHRYLAGEVKGRKLAVEVNGVLIEPYDPFYTENPATQPLEVEDLRVGKSHRVRIRPYVLPHYSKLALAEYDRLAGEEGFLRNQGFYVYRQHRLIISGTWFRLVRHGELSQLIRVSVDIPNALDSIWKITVDKSDAQLPAVLRNRLLQIVSGLKSRSSKVIRSKGGRLDRVGAVPVWRRHVRGGEIRYSINREHPLISLLLTDPYLRSAGTAALRAIEQSIPVATLGKDASDSPEQIIQISSDPRELLQQLEVALPRMLVEANGEMTRLIERLRLTEPFAQSWPLVEGHLKEKGWWNG